MRLFQLCSLLCALMILFYSNLDGSGWNFQFGSVSILPHVASKSNNTASKGERNSISGFFYSCVCILVRMKSFPRFLKNIHSAAHMNGLLVFIEMKQKRYQNGRLKKSFSTATKSWAIHQFYQFEWIWTNFVALLMLHWYDISELWKVK